MKMVQIGHTKFTENIRGYMQVKIYINSIVLIKYKVMFKFTNNL